MNDSAHVSTIGFGYSCSQPANANACFAGGFGGGGPGSQWQIDTYNGGMYIRGAGGGGGYSAGASGSSTIDPLRLGGSGGGGGSISTGDNPVNFSGYRAGDGLVTIERIR